MTRVAILRMVILETNKVSKETLMGLSGLPFRMIVSRITRPKSALWFYSKRSRNK